MSGDDFFEDLMEKWGAWWLRQGKHPMSLVEELWGIFFKDPSQEGEDAGLTLDMLVMKLEENWLHEFRNMPNLRDPDLVGGYSQGRHILQMFSPKNPLALTPQMAKASKIMRNPSEARKTSIIICSGASGLADVVMKIDAHPVMPEHIGQGSEADKRFQDFLGLHVEFMARYYIAIHCWADFILRTLRDRVRRLLFVLGYENNPRDRDYEGLKTAIACALRVGDRKDIHDAPDTDDYARDFIADAISDIKSRPIDHIMKQALKGSYGELRLESRYIDRSWKSRKTRDRRTTDPYEEVTETPGDFNSESSQKSQKLDILELLESTVTVGEQTSQGQDRSTDYGISPPVEVHLSDVTKSKLRDRFGPQAPNIIEVILKEDPELIFKQSGSLHQEKVAKVAGCHPNTVRNVMHKLRVEGKERLLALLDISEK